MPAGNYPKRTLGKEMPQHSRMITCFVMCEIRGSSRSLRPQCEATIRTVTPMFVWRHATARSVGTSFAAKLRADLAKLPCPPDCVFADQYRRSSAASRPWTVTMSDGNARVGYRALAGSSQISSPCR